MQFRDDDVAARVDDRDTVEARASNEQARAAAVEREGGRVPADRDALANPQAAIAGPEGGDRVAAPGRDVNASIRADRDTIRVATGRDALHDATVPDVDDGE